MHSNAKLTPRGRKEMVRRVLSGERLGDVSQGYGVSPRTVRKWMARYRAEGADGLRDRSSRPHKLRCLLGEVQLSKVRALRQRRMTGDAISRVLNQNRATIYRAIPADGHRRETSHDRQRPLLPFKAVPCSMQRTWSQTYPHPPVYASNQWQGGTFHQDSIERVGIRHGIHPLQHTDKSPFPMASSL